MPHPFMSDTERPFVTKFKFFGSGVVTGAVVSACVLVFVYYNFGYLFDGDNTTDPYGEDMVTKPGVMTAIVTVQEEVTIIKHVTGTIETETDQSSGRRKRDSRNYFQSIMFGLLMDGYN